MDESSHLVNQIIIPHQKIKTQTPPQVQLGPNLVLGRFAVRSLPEKLQFFVHRPADRHRQCWTDNAAVTL